RDGNRGSLRPSSLRCKADTNDGGERRADPAEVVPGYHRSAGNGERNLKREQNPFVLQLLKPLGRKLVELGRPGRAAPFLLLERYQNPQQLDLPAEVALVQLAPQNGLVDLLQLSQREAGGQQLEPDGGVFQFVPQPLQGVFQNRRMVEGQIGQTAH